MTDGRCGVSGSRVRALRLSLGRMQYLSIALTVSVRSSPSLLQRRTHADCCCCCCCCCCGALLLLQDISSYYAAYIRDRILSAQPTASKPFVLGLPTAASPKLVFSLLCDYVRKGELSFKHVVTFNMDDYVGVPTDHVESFHLYMRQQLYDHVDCPPENINLPNGNAEDLEAEAQRYEAKIASYGGIDLFLCGVGVDGHLAFNEPGSSLTSRTRVKTLSGALLDTHKKMFAGKNLETPRAALTVGVGTIMDSKEVLVIMTGANKALAVQQMLEGAVSHQWPITALQQHKNTMIGVDRASTQELKLKTITWYKEIEEIHTERVARAAAAAASKSSAGASSSSSSSSAPLRPLYIAGDIGATNARLQLKRAGGRSAGTSQEVLVGAEVYATKKYATLSEALKVFLAKYLPKGEQVYCMTLAVAGPVVSNKARITNLTWEMDGEGLKKEFGIQVVTLINDFVAVGLGVQGLSGSELELLYSPPPAAASSSSASSFDPSAHMSPDQTGVKGVLGAGTGLGECYLTHNGKHFDVHASEGGHADFAPRNEVETKMMAYIKALNPSNPDRVSNTRVISGMGLENAYGFFAKEYPGEANEEVATKIQSGQAQKAGEEDIDIGSVIAEAAREYKCKVCVRAMDFFACVYGAEAGNFGLRLLAYSGIYIAGGIGLKNVDVLRRNENQFLRNYLAKGRLSGTIARIPIYLIQHEHTGLLGSAVLCQREIRNRDDGVKETRF
jgi:glucosamine-6-phosphate isomerase/glucokinase